jgi:SPP1 gp7 family putative phage head morphogenesis protein
MLRFKARRKSPALKPRGELTPSERRVIRILDDAMQALRREVTGMQSRLADAVEHKSADHVANMISTDAWLDIQEPLQNELLSELLDAGSRVQLPPIRKAVLSYSFDRSREESARWAANEAGQLIREISAGQRDMVKDLVSRAQLSGIAPASVAREIRNGIGLTSAQAGWVSNFYERNLSANIANGMSVASATERAQAAADRYQTQVHRYRANTIARTEIMRANSEGRREAWSQGVEGGWIDPAAQKEWIAESDACEICEPLNGLRVPLNEEFPEGDPPAHPNCRCDLLLVDEVPQDIRDMTDEELDAEIASFLSGDPEMPAPAAVPGTAQDIATSLQRGARSYDEAGGEIVEIFDPEMTGVSANAELASVTRTSLDDMADLLGDEWADSEGVRYARSALDEAEVIVGQTDGLGVDGVLGFNVRSAGDLDPMEMDFWEMLLGRQPDNIMKIEYLGSTGMSQGTGSALTRNALQEAARRNADVVLEPASEGAEIFWRKMGFVDAPGSEGVMFMDADTVRKVVAAL